MFKTNKNWLKKLKQKNLQINRVYAWILYIDFNRQHKQYKSFFGQCINLRLKKENTTLTLQKTFNNDNIVISFPINSPIIRKLTLIVNNKLIHLIN